VDWKGIIRVGRVEGLVESSNLPLYATELDRNEHLQTLPFSHLQPNSKRFTILLIRYIILSTQTASPTIIFSPKTPLKRDRAAIEKVLTSKSLVNGKLGNSFLRFLEEDLAEEMTRNTKQEREKEVWMWGIDQAIDICKSLLGKI
jgi:hypothetical protein